MAAINREVAENIYQHILEIKGQTTESAIQQAQAQKLHKVWTLTEISQLISTAYDDFSSKVKQEYGQTSHANFAELVVSCQRTPFVSNLNKEIIQVLGKA